MAKVDVEESKKLQGLLHVHGADLQLERTSEFDIKDAESSQAFAEKAKAIAEEKVFPRCDEVEIDSRRRQRFAEVPVNQLNQPMGDWGQLDHGAGDGRRLVQEWRYGRQPLDLNSHSLAAKKTMPSVYVGNLPLFVTKRELAGLFSPFGEIHDIWLANQRPDMDHTYGFVRFYDQESCVSACENMRGVEMRGRTLRVNLADEPIQDRSHKDSLVRQEPVERYYPKTENSEEKKLVWALRQSCSRFHSQHVLYANEFFLQLKDPQPGAGFCANRLVVDFDEVLSWLDDIPEDLAPAVGDEGPAYTLQDNRTERSQQQRATRHSYSAVSGRYRNQQHSDQQPTSPPRTFTTDTNTPPPDSSPIEVTPILKKSDSETSSLADSDSPMMASLGSYSYCSNENITTNSSDQTELNREPLMSMQTCDIEDRDSAKLVLEASDTTPTSASISFKNPEEINMHLETFRSPSSQEKVHPSTGQLSPAALFSPSPGRPIRRMSPTTRRHYRSPRCLHPTSSYHVPGAPYPTMLSTTVPTAFTSDMFDTYKSGDLVKCPVGELIKLDEDTPNEVQLIELDNKETDEKTGCHTQELVALFTESSVSSQEHKDPMSEQPYKSNVQLLEELLQGCEFCPSSDVSSESTKETEGEIDKDIEVEMPVEIKVKVD